MAGKAKWKPLELPLPGKMVNQMQYHIPEGVADISVTINTSLCNFSIWPLHKTDRSWRMTGDCGKLIQVMTPIVAAVPDVISLLKEINIYPGT